MKKNRIVIVVEGGIASVGVNTMETVIDLHILDYDTDGMADKELCHCHLEGANAPHIHR